MDSIENAVSWSCSTRAAPVVCSAAAPVSCWTASASLQLPIVTCSRGVLLRLPLASALLIGKIATHALCECKQPYLSESNVSRPLKSAKIIRKVAPMRGASSGRPCRQSHRLERRRIVKYAAQNPNARTVRWCCRRAFVPARACPTPAMVRKAHHRPACAHPARPLQGPTSPPHPARCAPRA